MIICPSCGRQSHQPTLCVVHHRRECLRCVGEHTQNQECYRCGRNIATIVRYSEFNLPFWFCPDCDPGHDAPKEEE